MDDLYLISGTINKTFSHEGGIQTIERKFNDIIDYPLTNEEKIRKFEENFSKKFKCNQTIILNIVKLPK